MTTASMKHTWAQLRGLSHGTPKISRAAVHFKEVQIPVGAAPRVQVRGLVHKRTVLVKDVDEKLRKSRSGHHGCNDKAYDKMNKMSATYDVNLRMIDSMMMHE